MHFGMAHGPHRGAPATTIVTKLRGVNLLVVPSLSRTSTSHRIPRASAMLLSARSKRHGEKNDGLLLLLCGCRRHHSLLLFPPPSPLPLRRVSSPLGNRPQDKSTGTDLTGRLLYFVFRSALLDVLIQASVGGEPRYPPLPSGQELPTSL